MNNKDNKIHTFVTRKAIGKCPLCNNNVYKDNLFVEKDGEIYHFSCSNKKESERNK